MYNWVQPNSTIHVYQCEIGNTIRTFKRAANGRWKLTISNMHLSASFVSTVYVLNACNKQQAKLESELKISQFIKEWRL